MKDQDLDKMFREHIKDMDSLPPETRFEPQRAWVNVRTRMEMRSGGTGMRFWYMAAAIAILIAVSLLVWDQRRPDTPKTGTIAAVDSANGAKEAAPIPDHSPVVAVNEPGSDDSSKVEDKEAVQPVLPPQPEQKIEAGNSHLAAAEEVKSDSVKKKKRPLVEVKVILAEEKPDKESILRAEYEKQNFFRLRRGDLRTDRLNAAFENESAPLLGPGSQLKGAWNPAIPTPDGKKQ